MNTVRSLIDAACNDVSVWPILADYIEETTSNTQVRYLSPRGLLHGPVRSYGDGSGYGHGDGGDGDGGGGYGYNGDGVGQDDGGYGGYGDGYGDGGFGGCGDGGYDGVGGENNVFMEETLAIVTQSSGHNQYVLVGWCKHVRDFEWIIYSARIIRFFGHRAELIVLAANGPQIDTQLLTATVEKVFRPNVVQFLRCDISAWEKHCPKPG